MTPLVINLWFLAIDPVYVIPKESSIFVFEPTVMNTGSGDWWLYGEDRLYYYHFTGEEGEPTVSYRKGLALKCKGFDPTNYRTWCKRE